MALLAQPKRKVKYGIDPRNTSWSNDESKIGQKLMERMGWSKGKGLGANEDGMVDHIKASYKSDSRGLGCTPKDADAWIAHQDDFNDLLKTLNSGEDVEPKKETPESKQADGRKRFYGRFARGRVATLRSTEDLDCIFGKRKNEDKKEESSSDSDTPAGGEEHSHGLTTHTSKTSVQEYFAQKMAQRRAAQAAAGNTAEPFGSQAGEKKSPEEPKRDPGSFAAIGFSYDNDNSTKDNVDESTEKPGSQQDRGWYENFENCKENENSEEVEEKDRTKKKKKKKKSKNEDIESLPVSDDSENLNLSKKERKKKKKEKKRAKKDQDLDVESDKTREDQDDQEEINEEKLISDEKQSKKKKNKKVHSGTEKEVDHPEEIIQECDATNFSDAKKSKKKKRKKDKVRAEDSDDVSVADVVIDENDLSIEKPKKKKKKDKNMEENLNTESSKKRKHDNDDEDSIHITKKAKKEDIPDQPNEKQTSEEEEEENNKTDVKKKKRKRGKKKKKETKDDQTTTEKQSLGLSSENSKSDWLQKEAKGAFKGSNINEIKGYAAEITDDPKFDMDQFLKRKQRNERRNRMR